MRVIISLGLFVLFGLPARADLVSIQLSGLPAYQYGGFYVGPAGATDNGVGPIDLWCDDFTHDTFVPTTYYADVSTIPSTTARFSLVADAAHQYEEIAWLIAQYYVMSNKTNQSVGDLQFAIWLVFDPNQTNLQTTGALNWLHTAQSTDVSAYNGARIFTPTNCSGSNCVPTNQEFVDPPPVPEPTSIVLLRSAALLTLIVIRKKKRSAATKCGPSLNLRIAIPRSPSALLDIPCPSSPRRLRYDI